MATAQKEIKAFVSGTHNLIDSELIPRDAASSSIGWLTKDGKIELMYGRQAHGDEGTAGKIWGQHVGYKTDGTAVHFRKADTAIQYLNGSTWTNVITGLTASDVVFANHTSLAGAALYVSSPEDGLFKIMIANPGDYSDLNDTNVNYKGYFKTDKSKGFLWGREANPNALYWSHNDTQNATVYTAVAAEAVGASGSTNYTGTLAFKAGGSTRTCFDQVFTDGTQTITFNNLGEAVSGSDGTGTVNFTTGAYDVTFNATTTGSVTINYSWEDSNALGITDFTFTVPTRTAAEGLEVFQDAGGDAIKVVIPYDGSYFSIKENSVYKFTWDSSGTNPTNELIRTNVGVESLRAAVGTSAGIVFLNTGNPTRPELNILKRNVVGDNFDVSPLFPQFKFGNYTYTDVMVASWDKFVIVGCGEDSTENNRLLLCDVLNNTVDVSSYGVRTTSKDGGFLYGGDPVSTTCYELFTGFDDMGLGVVNSWVSAGDKYGSDSLKKTKKYRFRGQISPDQEVKISLSLDGGGFQHIGTILGSGDYVDYTSSYAIGTTVVGTSTTGGDDADTVYKFLLELKVRSSKFRKRQLKFEATELGYVAIQEVTDFDIWEYQNKLPKQYRLKQNVSLDGTTTDEASPTY